MCTFLKGSYTIEATVILPIFVCLGVFMIFYMRILGTEMGIQRILDETGQQVAVVSAYTKEITKEELVLICNGKIQNEQLPLSYIKGNLLGISYEHTSLEGNYVRLIVHYKISFPIKMFGNINWTITQRSIHRKWVGWDKDEAFFGEYVYITPYGKAYHCRYGCPYLQPAIHAVDKKTVKEKRNSEGGKYSPCKVCKAKRKKEGVVYITTYGEVYHASLGCSGLKRTIYRRRVEEIGNRVPCVKCGRRGKDGNSSSIDFFGDLLRGGYMEKKNSLRKCSGIFFAWTVDKRI